MSIAQSSLEEAVAAVRAQQVIAYPTEAVFGLGCDPRCVPAVQRILDIKGRDADKGLILIASNQQQLIPYIAPIEPQWQSQFDQHWPGHVTFIVPVSQELTPEVSALLTGTRDTIAVRVSKHPVVASLCQQCNSALVSTSANRSGQQALRTASQVRGEFSDEVAAVVDSAVGNHLNPSRIVNIKDGSFLR